MILLYIFSFKLVMNTPVYCLDSFNSINKLGLQAILNLRLAYHFNNLLREQNLVAELLNYR